MTIQSRYLSILYFFIIVVIGIFIGYTLIRVGNFDLKWTISILLVLCCILLWPIYGKLSKDPVSLLWIILILSIPFEFNIHLAYREYVGTFNGILFTITDIALFFLIMIWLYQLASDKTEKIRFYPQVTIPILFFYMTNFFSLTNSPDMNLSFFSIVQNLKTVILFFFIANKVRDKAMLQMIFKFLMICLIVEGLFCILQFITKTNFTIAFKVVESAGDDIFRIGGTTGSPNVTASYLASMISIPLLFLIMNDNQESKLLPLLSAGIGLIAFILTQTRGAWISFIVGIFFFFLLNIKKYKGMWKLILISVIIIGLTVLIFHNIIIERFSKGTETVYYRLHLIQSALEMVRKYPIFGIGPNIYALVMKDYVPFFLTQERWIVHNHYLLVWAELGTIGLIAFLIVIFSVFRYLWPSTKNDDSFIRIFAWGIWTAMFIFFLQMLFESLDGRISDSHLYLLFGLSVGIRSYHDESVKSIKSEIVL